MQGDKSTIETATTKLRHEIIAARIQGQRLHAALLQGRVDLQAANDFELVLVPHYGWGPPNPAGYEVLPSIAPGASRGVTFSPGVLYSNAGTFTLRILVTDDWYATGNPDSTGSGGDIWDETIIVGGE